MSHLPRECDPFQKAHRRAENGKPRLLVLDKSDQTGRFAGRPEREKKSNDVRATANEKPGDPAANRSDSDALVERHRAPMLQRHCDKHGQEKRINEIAGDRRADKDAAPEPCTAPRRRLCRRRQERKREQEPGAGRQCDVALCAKRVAERRIDRQRNAGECRLPRRQTAA